MDYTSTVFQQDGGAWYAAIRWREDGKGKRKTRKLAATTKRAALKELKEWERSLDYDIAPLAETDFYQYVQAYITSAERSRAIEPATAYTYRCVSGHIREYLPGVRLDQLTKQLCQKWVNDMNERLSPATVRKVYQLAKAAAQDAVYNGDLAENPFNRVRTPKMGRTKPNALTESDRKRLKEYLAMAGMSQLNIAILISLYCGLRQGEICGLQWRDVDLEERVLYVRKAVGRIGGKAALKDTKTDKWRDCPMPTTLVDALQDWRCQMAAERQELGLEFSDELYVIGDADGAYYRPDRLSKEWAHLAKSMNLRGMEGKRCTFHDLRHTFATAAIAGGVDVKTVSSILGHANAAMTLNIYASADPNAKAAAARIMDNLI